MECNKEDAQKSKELAESKLKDEDIMGSRKFALKAKQLFPDLPGLSQLLAVLDVHIAVHEKLQCGEPNWYAVLQADMNADENALRKQYRRLALQLHPDKNRAVGAEAAFKYISEAWSLLSDAVKKSAYDNKIRGAVSKRSQTKETRSKPSQPRETRSKCSQKAQPQPPTDSSGPKAPFGQSVPSLQTFWTACPSCKMQLEYERIHIDKTLCCPICRKPFTSKEVDPVRGPVVWTSYNMPGSMPNGYNPTFKPKNGDKFTSFMPNQQKQNAEVPGYGSNFGNPPSFQPHSTGKENKETDDRRGGNSAEQRTKSSSQQAFREHNDEASRMKASFHESGSPKVGSNEAEKAKAGNNETGNCKEAAAESVKMKSENHETGSHNMAGNEPGNTKTKKNAKANATSGVVDDDFKGKNQNPQTIKREAAQKPPETRKKRQKKMETDAKTAAQAKKAFDKLLGRSNTNNGNEQRENARGENVKTKNKVINGEEVPDADFFDFDSERTEGKFSDGQIWACYDVDGMPRWYARVTKVLCISPFRMKMSWLESKYASTGTLNSWASYKIGSKYIADAVNTFSHLVAVESDTSGNYLIYPKQGEVWALYQDSRTRKSKREKTIYCIVKVLTTYAEEKGVQVSSLFRVQGFRTVFKESTSGEHAKWIPSDDIKRFSHQIPAYPLVANQVPDMKGSNCWDLDPASTPTHLIEAES